MNIIPALFAHKYPGRAGSVKHCAVCGKKVNEATCWWVGTIYGSEPVPIGANVDDTADSGSFPIGPECAKRFPTGYLERS